MWVSRAPITPSGLGLCTIDSAQRGGRAHLLHDKEAGGDEHGPGAAQDLISLMHGLLTEAQATLGCGARALGRLCAHAHQQLDQLRPDHRHRRQVLRARPRPAHRSTISAPHTICRCSHSALLANRAALMCIRHINGSHCLHLHPKSRLLPARYSREEQQCSSTALLVACGRRAKRCGVPGEAQGERQGSALEDEHDHAEDAQLALPALQEAHQRGRPAAARLDLQSLRGSPRTARVNLGA